MRRDVHVAVALVAALGWIALGIQFTLMLRGGMARGIAIDESIFRFFGFFTNLTNVFIATVLTTLALVPRGRTYLTRGSLIGAGVVYILVVSGVYEIVLRPLADPRGVQFLADMVLHDVVPVAYTLLWAFALRRGRLSWGDPLRWLVYPILYFAYSLIRGAATNRYPYFFMDARRLGYERVAINAALLLLLFLALGVLVVSIDRSWQPTPRET